MYIFATKESRFECTGQMTSPTGSTRVQLLLKILENSWWVQQYSRSQGSLHLEHPNKSVNSYENVRFLGEHILITQDGQPNTGSFAKRSGLLFLPTTSGNFEGTCLAK
jgi:hypothetical protein